MSRAWFGALAAVLLGACIPVHRTLKTASGGAAAIWNFEGAQAFAPASGPATLAYRDPTRSGWGALKTRFVRTGEFGVASLPDGDKTVMHFPATTPNEGFTLTHLSPPNGEFAREGAVSEYTLVMDLLWPKASSRVFRSLFQTNLSNSDDGDVFAQPAGGIGAGGLYVGALKADRWQRVALVVSASSAGTGQIKVYLDGRFAGEFGAPVPGKISRWALRPNLHLFTDDNNETAEGYLSSLLFMDRPMTAEELQALGGPSALGIVSAPK